jgi:hypothetical protein
MKTKQIELNQLERLDVQFALCHRIKNYWKFRDSAIFRDTIKRDVKLIRKIGILKAK